MKMQTIKQAFYKSIPVMAGYVFLGIGFGILIRNAGYGLLAAAAIIGMLVIYCFKDTVLTAHLFGIPELIAAACVVGLQVWKRNSLISILTGTVVYMLLVQLVF